ncbi:ribonuclease Z, partial [Candidatus Woesearchaeota archaeon]|nr:ribonuclease Z [Candidatus Woesearchaeota archaeon]
MVEIIFLGTSCMQPTKKRNHPSFMLSYKTENILFDCGEN